MTREEITRLAREAGMKAMRGSVVNGKYEPKVNALNSSVPVEWLERFAALVAYAEMNRCCSLVYSHCDSDNVAQRTVDAIRARSA